MSFIKYSSWLSTKSCWQTQPFTGRWLRCEVSFIVIHFIIKSSPPKLTAYYVSWASLTWVYRNLANWKKYPVMLLWLWVRQKWANTVWQWQYFSERWWHDENWKMQFSCFVSWVVILYLVIHTHFKKNSKKCRMQYLKVNKVHKSEQF